MFLHDFKIRKWEKDTYKKRDKHNILRFSLKKYTSSELKKSGNLLEIWSGLLVIQNIDVLGLKLLLFDFFAEKK